MAAEVPCVFILDIWRYFQKQPVEPFFLFHFFWPSKSTKSTKHLTFPVIRNSKTQNKQLKEAAYRTYECPHVVYCSTIWHPWQKHLTHRLEMVQRSDTRYVSKWLSLHKQCHKHAQRVKVVYSWAPQQSSQSHNATQNT